MRNIVKKTVILCFVLLCSLILSCSGGGGSSDKKDPGKTNPETTNPEQTDPETVTISDITGITAPKYGQTPVAMIDETEQFTGTVTWSPSHGTFAATTVYTATITLEAKTGFTFDDVQPDFFDVTGAASVSNSAGVVTAVFPRTLLGDQLVVTVGSEIVYLNYANNLSTVTFPTGTSDNATATIDKKFFMSETEVTNAVFKEVLQWAYDNHKLSTTSGADNEVTVSNVKFGGQSLINLSGSFEYPSGVYHTVKIAFDASEGEFTVDPGFEDHPVVYVSWYGAIMFCNWLTEMRDGNTTNVVYTGIDTTWVHTETTEDATKNGYRLPSSNEWEYAARYRGTDTDNTVTGTIDGTDFSAMSIKWTKGDSASGAIASYDNDTATRAVAWYWDDPDMGTNSQLMPVATVKQPNVLGLYDMSGNVWEWCFDLYSGSARIFRGGSWCNSAFIMRVGIRDDNGPGNRGNDLGFRFVRTE